MTVIRMSVHDDDVAADLGENTHFMSNHYDLSEEWKAREAFSIVAKVSSLPRGDVAAIATFHGAKRDSTGLAESARNIINHIVGCGGTLEEAIDSVFWYWHLNPVAPRFAAKQNMLDVEMFSAANKILMLADGPSCSMVTKKSANDQRNLPFWSFMPTGPIEWFSQNNSNSIGITKARANYFMDPTRYHFFLDVSVKPY